MSERVIVVVDVDVVVVVATADEHYLQVGKAVLDAVEALGIRGRVHCCCF